MIVNSETLVTSSGVIRNRSKPRVGIVNASSLYYELIDDCYSQGIDLTYESVIEDTLERLRIDHPRHDDDEINDMLEKEMECMEFDSHTFLLGAWVKNANGQYEIDKSGNSGDYALDYNTESGMVSVEWSQLTKECGNTSPCYVMADGSGPCGDLDSKGNAVIAYTLPADMFLNDSEK